MKSSSKDIKENMRARRDRSNSIVQRRRMSLVHQHLETLHGHINKLSHTLSAALPQPEESGTGPTLSKTCSTSGGTHKPENRGVCKGKARVVKFARHSIEKKENAAEKIQVTKIKFLKGKESRKGNKMNKGASSTRAYFKTPGQGMEEKVIESFHESDIVDFSRLMCELEGISTSTDSMKESISALKCIEIELLKLFEEHRPWVDDWEPGIFSEVTREMDDRIAEISSLLGNLIDAINKKEERASEIERQLVESDEDATEVIDFREHLHTVVAQCNKLNTKLQTVSIHRGHG